MKKNHGSFIANKAKRFATLALTTLLVGSTVLSGATVTVNAGGVETPVEASTENDQGNGEKATSYSTLDLAAAKAYTDSNHSTEYDKNNGSYVIPTGSTVYLKAESAPEDRSFQMWRIISGKMSWENEREMYKPEAVFNMPEGFLDMTAVTHSKTLSVTVGDNNPIERPYKSDQTVQEFIDEIKNEKDADGNLKYAIAENAQLYLNDQYLNPQSYIGSIFHQEVELKPNLETLYNITVNNGKAITNSYAYNVAYDVIQGIPQLPAYSEVYLYAETKQGKILIGWSDANNNLEIKPSTKSLQYSFDTPHRDVVLTAHYRDDTVVLGGVELKKGQYVGNGSKVCSPTRPDDHYAYLSEDGTELTLHNYDNNGETFLFNEFLDWKAALILPQKENQPTLRINLEGKNTLSGGRCGIAPSYSDGEPCQVTFAGKGTLNIKSEFNAAYRKYNRYLKIDSNQYLLAGTDTKPLAKEGSPYGRKYAIIGLENVPVPENKNFTYDGNNHTFIEDIDNIPAIEIVGGSNFGKDAGTYEVTVRLADNRSHWSDETTEDKTCTFTIKPKQLKGEPEVSTVTESGKTLNDVTLTAPSDWPAGHFTWNDDDETEVTLETSYGWTFTPEDTNNYIGTKGKVIPWKKVLQPGKESIVADNESGTVKVAEVQLLSSDSEAIKEIAKSSPKAQVQEGDDIKLQLKVEDKEIAKDVQENAVEKAKEKLEDATFGASFDLTLELFKNGRYVENITDTNDSEISVTVKIPDDLIKDNRSYRVVREHDGKYDVLDTTYNKDSGTLTFATDKFSTYFIVYSDTVKIEEKKPEVKADTHVHEYQWEYDYADSETDDIVAYNRCKYCGDTKESHTIPNSAYYNWNLGVAKKIAAAKQNAVVTIDTTKWTTFHEMVLHALEKRPDVALRVRYTVVGGKDNGKRRQLLIPAVTAEDTVASAKREGIKDRFVNKFCGFGNLADFEVEYQYGNKK